MNDKLFGIISWEMSTFSGNAPELLALYARLSLHFLTISKKVQDVSESALSRANERYAQALEWP